MAESPTDALLCGDVHCGHSATDHGLVFNPETNTITFGATACRLCECRAFASWPDVAEAPWFPPSTLIPQSHVGTTKPDMTTGNKVEPTTTVPDPKGPHEGHGHKGQA